MKLLKTIFIMSLFCVGLHSKYAYSNCCDSTTRIGSCTGADCSHCPYKYAPRQCKSKLGIAVSPSLLDATCTPVKGVATDGTCPTKACTDQSHVMHDHTCDANGAQIPLPSKATDLCVDPTC